jgi:outer membrane protein OmpA-like peptidoglycan-associated protein
MSSEGGAGSLLMSRPGDAAEREADEAARNVTDGVPHVQRKSQAGTSQAGTSARAASSDVARAVMTRVGEGAELPRSVRSSMEGYFGEDLGGVRVHTGDVAARATKALGAEAFTVGSSIVFGQGRFDPESSLGRGLLAHELTHVVQQRSRAPGIQGRLLLTGGQPDIEALLNLMGDGAGLVLDWDSTSTEVSVIGQSANPATSPLFAGRLQSIINSSTDVRLSVGRSQPDVLGGQFPPNLNASHRVQKIDLEDMENLEANLPGYGLAAVAHEMEENLQAQAIRTVILGNTSQFRQAHKQAFAAESDVMQDVYGGGRLVAEAREVAASGAASTIARDFETHYVVIEETIGANNNRQVDNTYKAVRIPTDSFVFDSFAVGVSTLPARALNDIGTAAGAMALDPLATMRIEGFADSTGEIDPNQTLSQARADACKAELVSLGVDSLRIHAVGLGESNFVASNNNDADRARNRRVEITIAAPGGIISNP